MLNFDQLQIAIAAANKQFDLLIRIADQGGDWFVLPGGGQNHEEPLRETVQRECLEEIGVPVQVGELRLVREFIGKNHDDDEGIHRVEFMFECQIDADAVPSSGMNPDIGQTGIVWAPFVERQLHFPWGRIIVVDGPLAEVATYRLYPTGLGQILRDGVSSSEAVYMGDVA